MHFESFFHRFSKLTDKTPDILNVSNLILRLIQFNTVNTQARQANAHVLLV